MCRYTSSWCWFAEKLGKFGGYNLNGNTKILFCICSFGIETQIIAENSFLVPYYSFELVSRVDFREQQFIFADEVVWNLLIDWKSCLVLRRYKTTCRYLKLPLVRSYAEQKIVTYILAFINRKIHLIGNSILSFLMIVCTLPKLTFSTLPASFSGAYMFMWLVGALISDNAWFLITQ